MVGQQEGMFVSPSTVGANVTGAIDGASVRRMVGRREGNLVGWGLSSLGNQDTEIKSLDPGEEKYPSDMSSSGTENSGPEMSKRLEV